jgi:hypothetical protein
VHHAALDGQDAYAVYLDDEGVIASGSRLVCPILTTTYTMRVILNRTGCPGGCPLEVVIPATVAVVDKRAYFPALQVSRPCTPPLPGTVSIL